MTYIDVGDRIRDARKRMGLNQEELAEMARLNRVTVAKYESGKVEPGAQALSRIADALEVTVDELLGREVEQGSDQVTYTDPDDALRFALYGGDADEITPAQLDEIRRFAAYVKDRDKHDGK